MRTILLAAAFVAAALLALHVGAQTPQMGLPDVSVTAPNTTTRPQPRDSMISKWRNEEDKFVEAPCGTTRLTATASNARCLVGYRLENGMTRFSNRRSPAGTGGAFSSYGASTPLITEPPDLSRRFDYGSTQSPVASGQT